MSKIMVIATLRLNDESLLDDWKVISAQITATLEGQDGFIYRDSCRGEDGLIYCILKWESRAKQEKFMSEFMARTDEQSQAAMKEFERVVNVESMTKEILEII